MKIGIWHWSTKPFNGQTVRREPSGGTETAIAYTSEAIAALGHEVFVFCNTPGQEQVNGVQYLAS